MPCPFFEPRAVVTSPALAGVRLPLIEQYSGVCHSAARAAFATGAADLVSCNPGDLEACNHGYARLRCSRFPSNCASSAMRYSITRRTAEEIELLWLEEQDFSPTRWGSLRYSIENDAVVAPGLGPIIQAQALAFCRSFLVRLLAAERETNV